MGRGGGGGGRGGRGGGGSEIATAIQRNVDTSFEGVRAEIASLENTVINRVAEFRNLSDSQLAFRTLDLTQRADFLSRRAFENIGEQRAILQAQSNAARFLGVTALAAEMERRYPNATPAQRTGLVVRLRSR